MLLSKHISEDPQARVLVLFGGNPDRRDEIIRHLRSIPALSIIGALSEAEGLQIIHELPRTDMVLIGGRYTPAQRNRIKLYLAENYPHIRITEPGVDYPYDELLILDHVRKLMP